MGGVCPNASENGQISPRPPSGLPEVTVAVRIALLPCREPGKPRISKPVPGSSGESRIKEIRMSIAQYASVLALLSIGSPASSEWKPEYGNASSERQSWFQSQTINPDAQKRLGVSYKSCCDNGDVFKTRFRVNSEGGDQWEYLEDGKWKVIPTDIIHEEPSLDNTPILFKNRLTGQELCFFKPQGGL